jgi:hypothetical protein
MKKLIAPFTLLLGFTLQAQNESPGNWLMYFGNFRLHNNFNIHNEVQFRCNNPVGDLNQLLVRNGIGYTFKRNSGNILLGHAYVLSTPYIKGSTEKTKISEHRIYQQFISKQEIGRLLLLHRYRTEQRFLSESFRFRFRYFLAAYLPVNHSKIEKNTAYLAAYNEIFVNTKDNIFDRNRLYVAVGYAITDHMKLEAGTMIQFFENQKITQLQVGFYNNIAFKNHSK